MWISRRRVEAKTQATAGQRLQPTGGRAQGANGAHIWFWTKRLSKLVDLERLEDFDVVLVDQSRRTTSLGLNA